MTVFAFPIQSITLLFVLYSITRLHLIMHWIIKLTGYRTNKLSGQWTDYSYGSNTVH